MASIIKVNDLQNLSGGSPTLGGTAKDLLGIGGDGYSWIDETANRDLDTTYTNNTGKPIEVSITIYGDSEANGVQLIVDDIVITYNKNVGGDNVDRFQMGGTVPNGVEYKLINFDNDDGRSIDNWSELK